MRIILIREYNKFAKLIDENRGGKRLFSTIPNTRLYLFSSTLLLSRHYSSVVADAKPQRIKYHAEIMGHFPLCHLYRESSNLDGRKGIFTQNPLEGEIKFREFSFY